MGYPWLPALLLTIDAVLLVLFGAEDQMGVISAVALCALCIPFAALAQRGRGTTP
jgi:hypothetical protein